MFNITNPEKLSAFGHFSCVAEIKSLILNIQSEILADEFACNIGICHCDLLAGNLIKNNGELYIIDFEYACMGPVLLDIANNFNEFGGLECDWSLFPDIHTRFQFYRQ